MWVNISGKIWDLKVVKTWFVPVTPLEPLLQLYDMICATVLDKVGKE